MNDDDRRRLASDTAALRRFMLFSLGSRASWRDRVATYVAHLVRTGRRNASYVPW
jgi:hypothetical protein